MTVVNKSINILNFISCNCYRCVLRQYLTLVHLTLEYACCAWDPYTQHNISSMEKDQRRAACFVFCDYSCESSISCMLSALDWPLLSQHHECQLFV